MPRCRPSPSAACRPPDSVTRAFERAYAAVEQPIKQLARKRRHDPDDLYAEVGLRAWEDLCRPDAVVPASWTGRLIRIAHNVLADEGRRRRADARALGLTGDPDEDPPAAVASLDAIAHLADVVEPTAIFRGAAGYSADPHDVLVAREERHRFYAALATLSGRDREAIEDLMDGVPIAATAGRHHTNPSRISQRRRRATRRIRDSYARLA